MNALTPNAPLSAFAAGFVRSALSPLTFVLKPERVTFGFPVSRRMPTRAPPTLAESVIRLPTDTR